jgi:NADH-quinone oxidoreductase subunit I
MRLLPKIVDGIRGLLSGMRLTLGYFLSPRKVITQQYPENRETLKIPPRFRGRIELVKEAEGGYKCTACGLCIKACPNNSISLEKMRNPETKKLKLTKYEYRFDRCTLCGLCVDACKFEALQMGNQFESAVYDRAQLIQILNDDYQPLVEPPPSSDKPVPGSPPENDPAAGAKDQPKYKS